MECLAGARAANSQFSTRFQRHRVVPRVTGDRLLQVLDVGMVEDRILYSLPSMVPGLMLSLISSVSFQS